MDAEQLNDVVAPMVHLNGTGGDTLLREVEEALEALQVAEEKINNMTVHSRDYYVMEDADNKWQAAWKQAVERNEKIKEVKEELVIYRWKIRKQVKNNS